MLALASPLALAQVRGEPLSPPAPQLEVQTDEKGERFVMLHGRKVKAEDYEKLMAGEGVIDGTGLFIPNAEMAQAEEMLNRQLSGQPSY